MSLARRGIENMTEPELKIEWGYRYQERLGILCGADQPTAEQEKLAHQEADEAVGRLRGQGDFPTNYKGSRTVAELNELFNQCFRIQREVSAAAGHYVPMIVENVRGAQRWVGKAKWNFGSFYLWGDVPALMPIPQKTRLKTHSGEQWNIERKNFTGPLGWNCDALKHEGNKMGSSPGKIWRDRPPSVAAHRELTRSEGRKTAGMNWSDRSIKGQDFTRIAGQQAEGGVEGNNNFKDFHDSPIAALGSKSKARKEASAMIAKIPPTLASWIAKTYKPGVTS